MTLRFYSFLAFLLLSMVSVSAASAASSVRGGENEKRTYIKLPKTYRFRISLTDKKNCGYSVKHPEKFLSPASLARRKRFGLKVDSHDLPLTQTYVSEICREGVREVNRSKWNNSLVVEVSDTSLLSRIRNLPFVKDANLVWISPDSILAPVVGPNRLDLLKPTAEDTLLDSVLATMPTRDFGARQSSMIGADTLHARGFTGKGVTIAVIDGGFLNVDVIPGLQRAKILGTRNFVHPDLSVYATEESHGTNVLSCIAARESSHLTGTAPDASFYLFVSEDGLSEQAVEEDNWCAAVEYADSLGCDIVTSSLGYTQFQHDFMNTPYASLDGKSHPNSRSASLAASRGIVLLNSAGNSGDEPWKKIGFPADADHILAVGAVDSLGVNTNFSSVGHAADGRVKPDVMAMGQKSFVLSARGRLRTANGTSFSCPILCGGVACLMQACPKATPEQIVNAVKMSGNNAAHPDNIFGYGIPSLPRALEMLQK